MTTSGVRRIFQDYENAKLRIVEKFNDWRREIEVCGGRESRFLNEQLDKAEAKELGIIEEKRLSELHELVDEEEEEEE